jgi:hypothetical protein
MKDARLACPSNIETIEPQDAVSKTLWGIICSSVSKRIRGRRFKRVSGVLMADIQCPACQQVFGINPAFAEIIDQTNFRYACPYCRTECNADL